jgi:hypothetical protein
MIYNRKLLEEICARDNCIIDYDVYKEINSIIKITYICGTDNCENEGCKGIRCVYKNGAFCKDCMNKKSKEKSKKTCLEKYGVENPLQSAEIKEKSKKTCLEKYGVAHPCQSVEVKEKSKKTCLEKYGVAYSLQSTEVKEKSKNTMLEKYGVENISSSNEIKDKKKATFLEKYGVENISQLQEIKDKKSASDMKNYGVPHHFQAKEIKDKIKETCLEKYGVSHIAMLEETQNKMRATRLEKYGYEHHLQNPLIIEKQHSGFTHKKYDYDGNIIYIQGYENYALDLLKKNGYIFSDIITDKKDVPEIWYKNIMDDKNHRYYCDIFIPKENKIIEVKSEYIYEREKDKNIEKMKACIENGYVFEFWFFDKKGEKIDIEI